MNDARNKKGGGGSNHPVPIPAPLDLNNDRSSNGNNPDISQVTTPINGPITERTRNTLSSRTTLVRPQDNNEG